MTGFLGRLAIASAVASIPLAAAAVATVGGQPQCDPPCTHCVTSPHATSTGRATSGPVSAIRNRRFRTGTSSGRPTHRRTHRSTSRRRLPLRRGHSNSSRDGTKVPNSGSGSGFSHPTAQQLTPVRYQSCCLTRLFDCRATASVTTCGRRAGFWQTGYRRQGPGEGSAAMCSSSARPDSSVRDRASRQADRQSRRACLAGKRL